MSGRQMPCGPDRRSPLSVMSRSGWGGARGGKVRIIWRARPALRRECVRTPGETRTDRPGRARRLGDGTPGARPIAAATDRQILRGEAKATPEDDRAGRFGGDAGLRRPSPSPSGGSPRGVGSRSRSRASGAIPLSRDPSSGPGPRSSTSGATGRLSASSAATRSSGKVASSPPRRSDHPTATPSGSKGSSWCDSRGPGWPTCVGPSVSGAAGGDASTRGKDGSSSWAFSSRNASSQPSGCPGVAEHASVAGATLAAVSVGMASGSDHPPAVGASDPGASGGWASSPAGDGAPTASSQGTGPDLGRRDDLGGADLGRRGDLGLVRCGRRGDHDGAILDRRADLGEAVRARRFGLRSGSRGGILGTLLGRRRGRREGGRGLGVRLRWRVRDGGMRGLGPDKLAGSDPNPGHVGRFDRRRPPPSASCRAGSSPRRARAPGA